MQEVLLNLLCCGLYIAASTLLLTSVFTELYYLYHTVIGTIQAVLYCTVMYCAVMYYICTAGFTAYPALTAVYVLGFAAGGLHLLDAVLAFVFWRRQSSGQS